MKLFNILVFGLIGAASAQTETSKWYLVATGTPTASVGGTNTQTTPEIQLTYEISDQGPDLEVSLYNVDCVTPGPSTIVTPTYVTSPIQGTSRVQVTVSLDIDPTQLAGSSIYSTVGTVGKIELCVRFDVLDGIDSYNFNERKLFIDVDLSQDFAISTVSDRAAAGVTNANAATDFGLDVCQCNENSVCSTATITQGQAAFICIKQTANSGVTIANIDSLTYTKDAETILAIVSNNPDEMTTVQPITGGAGGERIQTQLPSALFETAGALSAEGTIVVSYGSVRSRQLRFSVGNAVGHTGGSASRLMQEQRNETQADFSVSMMLAPPPPQSEEPPKSETNPGVLIGGIVGGIAGVAIIVALVLAIRRKKEQDDIDDEEYKAGTFVCADNVKEGEVKIGSMITHSAEDDKEGEATATTISVDLSQEDEKEICA